MGFLPGFLCPFHPQTGFFCRLLRPTAVSACSVAVVVTCVVIHFPKVVLCLTVIVVRIAFKPTPSISLEQDSVDLATMTPAKLTVKGRHDRCVAYRGAVAAEAATAIALDDMLQEAGR